MAIASFWVQLFLALGWAMYVLYLPQLAAQAGIAKSFVPWLLIADQLVFAVMDWTLGVAADKVAPVLERLANAIVLVSLLSCLAFLALPFVAPSGSPALFVALTLAWSATSSALRAPPLVMLARHVPGPAQPWAAGLFMMGLGVAATLSPFLARGLAGIDPRWPFALSALALAAATIVMTRAIRSNPNPPPAPAAPGDPLRRAPVPLFLLAVALLGLGFQVHAVLNSAPAYLRFVKPEELPQFLPVFFVGFVLLILPATFLAERLGGLATMAIGAAVSGIAAVLVPAAGSLATLAAIQFVAGAGWGCVMMSALAAALAMGRTGREGFVAGGLWSLLALATLTRIAMVIAQVPQQPGWKPFLAWAPGALWLTAGLLLVAVAGATRGEPGARPEPHTAANGSRTRTPP